MEQVEKVIDLPETVAAPVEAGKEAGVARYLLNGAEIGSVPILYAQSVAKAEYRDYLEQIWKMYLL